MPEICEVHLIAHSLNQICSGKILTKITIDNKSKFQKQKIINLNTFRFPNRISSIYARGKKVLFEFENKQYIISSLGMEGHWTLKPGNHSNLVLEFEDFHLYFDDSRHFGNFEIALDEEELKSKMTRVGYCLFTDREKITKEWWYQQFQNKRIKKPVCDFLLEQKRFSGIGNWIRAEVLYHSQINPHRKIWELSEDEVETLRQNTFNIIDEAYKSGGLTFSTYWDPTGKSGKYVCKCYNRKKDMLGNPVITEKVGGGRMIHWVSEIQK